MPPHLLSNLLKALSNLSPNIRKNWKFSILAAWLTRSVFENSLRACMWCHSWLICIWSIRTRRPKMANFVWRIGNFSNILTLVSQCSYQISSQMRWHPLAPDKTLLQVWLLADFLLAYLEQGLLCWLKILFQLLLDCEIVLIEVAVFYSSLASNISE